MGHILWPFFQFKLHSRSKIKCGMSPAAVFSCPAWICSVPVPCPGQNWHPLRWSKQVSVGTAILDSRKDLHSPFYQGNFAHFHFTNFEKIGNYLIREGIGCNEWMPEFGSILANKMHFVTKHSTNPRYQGVKDLWRRIFKNNFQKAEVFLSQWAKNEVKERGICIRCSHSIGWNENQ
jgi:hypothetical protein